MEDFLEIYKCVDEINNSLEQKINEYMQKLRSVLHGPMVPPASMPVASSASVEKVTICSPQQTNKRPKCLSLVNEEEEVVKEHSIKLTKKSSELAANLEEAIKDEQNSLMVAPLLENTVTLPAVEIETQMPPPPTSVEPHEFLRPQRAAKLKSVKHLKEPSLSSKLRRPSNVDKNGDITIKKEDEQRKSQQVLNASATSTRSKQSSASAPSDSSVLIMPEKESSVVDLLSETEQENNVPLEETAEARPQSKAHKRKSDGASGKPKELRIKIKREKISLTGSTEANADPPSAKVSDKEAENKLKNDEIVPKPKLIKVESDETLPTRSAINTTAVNSSSTTAPRAPHTKKSKKKRDVPHVPIKVERFSDIDVKPSPISSRTRKGSTSRTLRQASVYEDALDHALDPEKNSEKITKETETPPARVSQVLKEVSAEDVEDVGGSSFVNQKATVSSSNTLQPNVTMVMEANDATFTTNSALQNTFQVPNPQVPNAQTTFIMDNPNATVTIATMEGGAQQADATFNVAAERRSSSKDNQSMETAKDTSNARADSFVTEDESYKSPQALLPPSVPAPKASNRQPNSTKSYKLPTRTNELFNPLVQSPVKKKVEAFEAAAVQQTKSLRSKRTKENALPTPTLQGSSTKMSNIGKLGAPALGRFLTPTQSANVTPNASQSVAQTKKVSSSASKIMPFSKTLASSLKSSASSSSSKSTLSRENSADDFRRCLNQMAETRKKQREQKHLLAAQQREAKEKERAERMAKLAKEREEKRLRKQADLDQQKKALEDIQRKLKQYEEPDAAKQSQMQSAKAKAIQEQERMMLQQMKPPKPFLAPNPKVRTNYTFEMLHEDDSTDDEDKVTYKRPPPPAWSRRAVRGQAINLQQYCPTEIIDSFFSVQAMSPDLKLIFPNIDDRYLKRNSSAFWSTPPRYSQLPKY